MRLYKKLENSTNGGESASESNMCFLCQGEGYISRLEKHEMMDGIKNAIFSNDYCYMCNGAGILHAPGNEIGIQLQ